MSPRLRWIAFAALPWLLAGCDDHLYGTSTSGCAADPPLTWENFGNAFLDDRCNGCHSSFYTGEDRSGAPEGVDFDTWAGVLQWADRIYARSVESQTMPPADGISPSDRVMLEQWLKCEVFPAAGIQ